MKKRVVCLLVLFLIIISGTAYATQWVYMGRGYSELSGDLNAYIDKDSIEKNGKNLIFWELDILDKVDENGVKKDMYKIEAIPSSPRQYRALEYYAYDVNDHEIGRFLTPTDFCSVDSLVNKEIDFALQYVK